MFCVCCGAVQHGTVATSGALSLAQLADIVTRAAGSDNVMDRVHYFILLMHFIIISFDTVGIFP